MFRLLTCSLMAAALFGQAASTSAPKAATKAPAAKAPAKKAAPVAEQIPLPAENGLYVVFNTTMGQIIALLYEKETPITVTNFVALAKGTKTFTDEKSGIPVRRPFYNGLTFHRVIPKFMIQGGDPLGNGMGGGGVPTIKDEFVEALRFDKPGVLAMANVGRPNTGGCQFFITTTDSLPSHLNDKHTIFGQVKVGQDVVDAISNVPQDPNNNKPLTPVIIKSVLIRRVGPDPNAPPKPVTKTAPKAAAKKT